MADLRGFNANNVEPTRDFEPIPAGKYMAIVTASEMKPNKAGTGDYLELTFTILEGEFKNRLCGGRYNMNNPSEMAVRIGQGELADLCRAVGVMTPRDSVDLHNLPVLIKVKCKKRKDTGEIVNEIKGYEKREAGGGRPQQAPDEHASLAEAVMFEIVLPYPPSVNHYWRHVGPRTLISRQGLAFRQEVEVRVWRSRGYQKWQPLVGPLDVEVLLYPPDQRRRDIDNALKSLLDALGHAQVYEDDSQVTRLTVERREKVTGGQCAVRIRSYDKQKGNATCS